MAPVAGTFPMLITSDITLSPLKSSLGVPSTGQRGVRAIGRGWETAPLGRVAPLVCVCVYVESVRGPASPAIRQRDGLFFSTPFAVVRIA